MKSKVSLVSLARTNPVLASEQIHKALASCHNVRKDAAKRLGVSRYQLARAMRIVDVTLNRAQGTFWSPPSTGITRLPRATLVVLVSLYRGNRTKAAEKIGVTPTTISRWISHYNLEAELPPSSDPFWSL